MPKPLQQRGNYEDYAHLRQIRLRNRRGRMAVLKFLDLLEDNHPSWRQRYERERVRL